MHTIAHVIGGERTHQLADEGLTVQADVEADLICAPGKAIQMLIKKEQSSLVQSDAFPDAVPNHEATVEQGHLGGVARQQSAIKVNQGEGVARIGDVFLAASHAVIAL